MRNIQSGIWGLGYTYTPPTKKVLFEADRGNIIHDEVNGEIILTNNYPNNNLKHKTIIADKNLGAVNVYDTGKFYQWGNNYGFDITGPTKTSTNTVDVSNYSRENPYSSDTFVLKDTWMSAMNEELWGNTTATDESRQGPCPNGWHLPGGLDNDRLYMTLAYILYGTTSQSALSDNDVIKYLLMPKSGYLKSTDGTYILNTSSGVRYGMFWTTGNPSGGTSGSESRRASTPFYYDSRYGKSFGRVQGLGIPIRPFKNAES